MTSEDLGSTPAPTRQAGWRAWLRVAFAALLLLLLSEALWLWQTWPVRELLESATVSAPRNP